MNKNLNRILTVAFVALLVFGGSSMTRASSQAGTTGVIGSTAPDFELTVVSGASKTMKLSELKGKAVLLNFWATYCEPCKVEMPWLIELQKGYGPQGLQVVGVAMDDDDAPKAVSAYSRKMGVNYPMLLGSEKVADLYGGVEGLPMSFFIDRSGKIVAHELGLVSREIIVENIKKALAGGSEPAKDASGH